MQQAQFVDEHMDAQLIVFVLGHLSVGSHARPPTDDDLRELVKKATDGCANIFVDAGANIGVHTRILFEPAKYPRSHFTRVFARTFGTFPDVAQLTCSLGFEPHCASLRLINVQPLQCGIERRGRPSCAAVGQGAGSSRALHTTELSMCTHVQLQAHHRSCSFVNASLKSAHTAALTIRNERAAAVPSCVVDNGFDSHNNE